MEKEVNPDDFVVGDQLLLAFYWERGEFPVPLGRG